MNTFFFDTSLAFTVPEVLVGEIMKYMRHDNAGLLLDAFKSDKLTLKYVGWTKGKDAASYSRALSERREIAPSTIKSTTYGDEDSAMFIRRSPISMGEKLRLRRIISLKN